MPRLRDSHQGGEAGLAPGDGSGKPAGEPQQSSGESLRKPLTRELGMLCLWGLSGYGGCTQGRGLERVRREGAVQPEVKMGLDLGRDLGQEGSQRGLRTGGCG